MVVVVVVTKISSVYFLAIPPPYLQGSTEKRIQGFSSSLADALMHTRYIYKDYDEIGNKIK